MLYNRPITTLTCILTTSLYATKITIMGCGYVGLTLAALLYKSEHQIICVDVDKNKIDRLNNYCLPFYEPDLDALLFKGSRERNIIFTHDIQDSMDAEIFYICVGTPTNAQGQCDCTYLHSAINTMLNRCKDSQICNCNCAQFYYMFKKIVEHTEVNFFKSPLNRKIICVKSTLPPGTMNTLQNYLTDQENDNFHLVYNPEFMREGSALHDICTTNPIVIGGNNQEALETIQNIYSTNLNPNIKIIKTNFETAEMIKYAWNSFSALRIAYINELALVCRKLGADIATTVAGFALSEQLLPTEIIKPGPGYGGSCLPKDTISFANILEHNGFPSTLVHQTIKSNKQHIERLIQDILSTLKSEHTPHTVTLLGLTFKAHTDDIRYAPSIAIIQVLLEQGITIQAYDPKGTQNMQHLFPTVHYCNSPYDAAKNSDCIVALTEWQEIKNIDLEKLAQLCRNKTLVDTRNIYDPKELRNCGFTYINMGRINLS